MAIVPHKYMTEEMPEEELRAIFAARQHTLDFLLERIREQNKTNTLNSFLISGHRGSGKTTLVLMLYYTLLRDSELQKHWLPIRFPEELQGVSSLRDLLSATLERLSQDNDLETASGWWDKVEQEPDDHQSLELAITGLREIAQQEGKRLVLFVENMDQVFERKLTENEQATLRKLLMVDPFLMVVGTTVQMFDAVQDYNEPLFNYFTHVPLLRLDDKQVYDILQRRAQFDEEENFNEEYQKQVGKIRAITRLTGGNPRILIHLYEILTEGRIGTTISALQQVVDELTPILKDVLENQFTEQQGKILDAIIRAGGTATPKQISSSSRLSLNTVTTQLKRLKDAQVLELRGGGKGRTANYSVVDQLFLTWYQMRYLRKNKRRLDIFVEFLSIWYAEEERLGKLKELSATASQNSGKVAYEYACTAEYFMASLKGSPHEFEAEEIFVKAMQQIGGYKEAALALVDRKTDDPSQVITAYDHLHEFHENHGDPEECVKALEEAIKAHPSDPFLQLRYGFALFDADKNESATECLEETLSVPDLPMDLKVQALILAGINEGIQGKLSEAINYLTKAIDLNEGPKYFVASALLLRGVAKENQNDKSGAIEDLTSFIKINDTSGDLLAIGLACRGTIKLEIGDFEGAFKDYTQVINITEAPVDQIARARIGLGTIKGNRGKHREANHEFLKALSLENLPEDIVLEVSMGAIASSLSLKDEMALSQTVSFISKAIQQNDDIDSEKLYLRLLITFSNPQHPEDWLKLYREILSNLKEEDKVYVKLRAFKPAAEVLETGDYTLLDSLPPEIRSFAEEILETLGQEPKTGNIQ